MTGLYELASVDWPTVRCIVISTGRHRLLHVPVEQRQAIAQAAAAVGLSVYVVSREVLEIRVMGRGGSIGPRLPRGGVR